ncbi:cytochrome b-c1 complex subunit 8 [Leptopilina boulardi]|uniref:cytochrome b-c1 complex subunit 8 n=1 Tax=Leptopilina boulardi TaxID=63433 RepID=UPI0021F69911|nr:cytochrome b-c1 complex subunit 8 [Leptopilina boulardi]
MGKAFGNLHYVRGIVFYRLSPFEQKSFAGIINPGLYNTARRFRESVFRVVPPFIVGYLVYDWGEKTYKNNQRKNPKDFENDT